MTLLPEETFLIAADAIRVHTNVIELIEGFEKLPDGWHFGEGVAAKHSTVERAQKIALIAATNGWELEAFPGISGDITVSCYRDELELEIIVKADTGYAFSTSVNDVRLSRNLAASRADVLDLIAFFGSCNTYGFYTPVIGVEENPSFQELPSEIFHRQEFPSFNQLAPLEADTDRSAVTLDTTTKRLNPRFSFGSLKKTSYLSLIPSNKKQPIKVTHVITTSTDFPTPPLKSISRTIFKQTAGQTITYAPPVSR